MIENLKAARTTEEVQEIDPVGCLALALIVLGITVSLIACSLLVGVVLHKQDTQQAPVVAETWPATSTTPAATPMKGALPCGPDQLLVVTPVDGVPIIFCVSVVRAQNTSESE